jgi:hypothetical protein
LREPHHVALRAVQERLEHLYGLEKAPDVSDFVRIGNAGSRETLLLRESEDILEMALILPPQTQTLTLDDAGTPTDHALQVLEGVSHFVYLAERARTGLPATQLELELQAEVDKFLLLGMSTRRHDPRTLHDRLYERVRFVHPENSEAGARYRLANGLAARFTARLVDELELVDGERLLRRLPLLRRFYRSGQTDKIRLARAA